MRSTHLRRFEAYAGNNIITLLGRYTRVKNEMLTMKSRQIRLKNEFAAHYHTFLLSNDIHPHQFELALKIMQLDMK